MPVENCKTNPKIICLESSPEGYCQSFMSKKGNEKLGVFDVPLMQIPGGIGKNPRFKCRNSGCIFYKKQGS